MSQPPKTRSSSEPSGTTSLILGDRPSVRFPRRTVPICVSDPIGFAMPLRMASTPAIVVVLTAPKPTSSTPSLPLAGAISTGVGMKEELYSTEMFLKRDDPYQLVVGMTGVKMGDQFVQIGCAHGGRLAAVAAKVGLTGRAVAVVPDEPAAARARKGAADAGVLVEIEIAPPTRLPFTDLGFDLAVVDDTAGLIAELKPEDRATSVHELLRVLRPGGR